ncbi:hypothetical protein Metfor_2011 [Methanoregula formicica SMSP]|uniref:Uncharacterized protein n=1 Tax=Methanoregula formicica (strain DSM 22288 / NBRC 105244 / SMSP) TaxID=593750 RepID=L0HG75_METFS|nr:hypothetical protein Metfor_2011 [Methanoregula formicica SMSP]
MKGKENRDLTSKKEHPSPALVLQRFLRSLGYPDVILTSAQSIIEARSS